MISFLTIASSIRTEQLSNCNTMRQMASPMLSVPLVLDDCCTWRSHSCPTMTTRTNPTMKEAETPKPARQEGAPHLDLAAPCLASSFSPARSSCRSSRPLPALPPPSSPRTSPSERTERAAPKATEIHKTRNPRPFTGFFFGLYMHPNRLLDLKIVFNQHLKPLNGITNVFCIGGRSGPVNFLFPFR